VSIVDVRPARPEPTATLLPAGTRVAVRNRYLGTWSAGFEVVEVDDDGYRIRRSSDGAEIMQRIAVDDVREPLDAREPFDDVRVPSRDHGRDDGARPAATVPARSA